MISLLRPRSLQLHLALRLAALFLVATAVAVAALVYETYETADSLSDQDLTQRARDLARSITASAAGLPALEPPPELAAAYSAPSETAVYVVRDAEGRVIAASHPEFQKLVSTWPLAGDEPQFFRLEAMGAGQKDYYGLSMRLDSMAGPVFVTVARATDTDALIHTMLREFAIDVAWIIPVFVGATLVVGILAIRSGLEPLRQVSAKAATIEPSALSVRLPEQDLPSEVLPLVAAVNRALDRLERGFAMQRQFTANAAHELRTPLAIVTGALDGIEGNHELDQLRQDVARMNRLVDQLLRVARLDAIALDVSTEVDLSALAAEEAALMAPLAIAQERAIAVVGTERPTFTKGSRHAIGDAIRNLIENAIRHTPPNTEVVVEIDPEGSISVSDHGAGVRPEERDHVFDRFWRGKESCGAGAGLGLAIVKEIMRAHGGEVMVSDHPGGGARFTLSFQCPGPVPVRRRTPSSSSEGRGPEPDGMPPRAASLSSHRAPL
jgi:two-component system, OmpR family, sensor histidine kinase TctE